MLSQVTNEHARCILSPEPTAEVGTADRRAAEDQGVQLLMPGPVLSYT